MSTQRLLILLVIVVALASTSMSLPTRKEGGTIYNIVYLGRVDGKSYFYEKTMREWDDGKKMCRESGMDLATIKSPEQTAFLKASYNTLERNAYWVDARETATLSRFSWNNTGEALNESLVSLEPMYPLPVEYCLVYLSSSDSNSVYWTRRCSEGNTYTLCEINH